MNPRSLLRARTIGLVAALGFSLALTGSITPGVAPAYAPASARAALEITPRELATSNQKVRMAHAALLAMWSGSFAKLGERFAAPDLIAYYRGVRTACGVFGGSNALYCPRDNTIYYDEVFVAAQAKRAARQLGTDGDMAGVGVIAHEMGHAVAIQLGHVSRISYENEATADCLAGAFAKQATHDGTIEAGDIDEAFYAMSTAGDPSPNLTGDPRTDGWILARAAMMGHGTREQRMQNFRNGLEGGAQACLPEFRNL